jgi:hypothetical protein
MKRLRYILVLLLAFVFTMLTTVNAQTFREEISSDFYASVMCLNKVLSGYWIYSISCHVDKDGLITRVHWNVKNAYLEDEEGNTYKLVDTGTDNYGGPLESLGGISFWDLWNNIAGYNAGAIDWMNDEYGTDYWLNMTDSDGNPLEDMVG